MGGGNLPINNQNMNQNHGPNLNQGKMTVNIVH